MKNLRISGLYALSVAAISTVLFECTRRITMNYIIGSSAACFSLNHCLTPLLGASTQYVALSVLVLLFRSLFRGATYALPTLLVYHIPSFFGALAFSCVLPTQKRTVKRSIVGAFLLCLAAAFIAHPIGYHAALYTTLWIIPLAALCMRTQNAFTSALISTFVTHAVGSVIWLYAFATMSAAEWLAIMPIAVVERLIFASGTTICYYCLHAVTRWIAHRTTTQTLRAKSL